MNCFDRLEELRGKSAYDQLHVLKAERNKFAKSRQAWISAAFKLAHDKDSSEFKQLVSEELCPTCIEHYEKHQKNQFV